MPPTITKNTCTLYKSVVFIILLIVPIIISNTNYDINSQIYKSRDSYEEIKQRVKGMAVGIMFQIEYIMQRIDCLQHIPLLLLIMILFII